MSRTQLPSNNEEPRWGVRLERSQPSDADRIRGKAGKERFRWFRVMMMSTFLLHFLVYTILMVMLMIINIASWDGQLWVIFPIVGWGALVAMHGGVTWLVANAGISSRMVDRARQPINVQVPTMSRPKPADPNSDELRTLMISGLDMVDNMRRIGRNMRSASARHDALAAVGSIEKTIIALENQTDELPLARDFIGSLVEPSHRIFVEYDRLSNRDVQSAKSLLQEVEQRDLPAITTRAEQVHERVNRGTMIDLEVAREMLNLGDRPRPLTGVH